MARSRRLWIRCTMRSPRWLQPATCDQATAHLRMAPNSPDRLVSIPRSRSRVTSRQIPPHAAIGELARKVATSPAGITEADLKPLRDLELSDVDILDVVLAAAARCFFSSVLEATGAVPDSAYANLDESLRKVLTVGRPIEQGGP